MDEDKSQVAPINEIVFLGFVFKGGKIRWSDKAFKESLAFKMQGLVSVKDLWVKIHYPAKAR